VFFIELQEFEHDLYKRIELDACSLRDHLHCADNAEVVAKLFKVLTDRNAIPAHRLRVFANDEYATGRGPSALKRFQRSNTYEETIRHPHFLKWLRYFVEGPDLPDQLVNEFQSFVTGLGHFSSSDIKLITSETRRLTRTFGLTHVSSDEMFRLSLEFGLSLHFSHAVRRSVLQAAKR
jgi:hypothetical protein